MEPFHTRNRTLVQSEMLQGGNHILGDDPDWDNYQVHNTHLFLKNNHSGIQWARIKTRCERQWLLRHTGGEEKVSAKATYGAKCVCVFVDVQQKKVTKKHEGMEIQKGGEKIGELKKIIHGEYFEPTKNTTLLTFF